MSRSSSSAKRKDTEFELKSNVLLMEQEELEARRSIHSSDFEHEKKKGEEGEGPWLISYADMMTLLMGFFALIASFSKPDIKAFEAVKKSATEKFGGQYKEPYEELAQKISRMIQSENLGHKVQVFRGPDGVTIKFDGSTFFSSGDFNVSQQGTEIIHQVTRAMKAEIPTHKAIIEGHTDNVPIRHSIIASNWELSGIRAARIAKVMEDDGFKKEQLIIQGWGETRPDVPNTDSAGIPIPENQAKNRRVVIKIYQE